MPTPNMRLWIRSPHDQIFNYALSSAYRSTWVYEPSLALARDPDIWEVVKSDPVIMSAMDRRMRAVVRPFRIEYPGSDQDERAKTYAGIFEDGLSFIHRFNVARRRLAEAHFLGRAYEYVEGERKVVSLAGGPKKEWWLPTRMRHIDRRRFRWAAEWKIQADPDRKVHLEMFNTKRARWERVDNAFRRALVEYVYADTEDRVGYGRGMLEATYFYHYFKTVVMQRGLEHLDRFANGILIGKIASLRNASVGKTNEDLKNSMKTLLQNMRTSHIAVMNDGDTIDIKETSGQGFQAVQQMLQYLDQAIERLYNGSVLPSGHASDTGSNARAKEEGDTSEAFYQDDRDDLDAVLTAQLVRLFYDNNRVNLAELGYTDERLPKLTSRQQKREDPKMAADVMGSVLDRGLSIVKKEYYERLNLSVPTESDDVVTASMVSGGPGMGPDGMPFDVAHRERELDRADEDSAENHKLEKEKLRKPAPAPSRN